MLILWKVFIFQTWRNQYTKAKHNAKVDRVTLTALPKDAPKGAVPIETVGDGNCFPCAISKALLGNESHHKEIRLLLVIEGVRNKVHYLDNNFVNGCLPYT